MPISAGGVAADAPAEARPDAAKTTAATEGMRGTNKGTRRTRTGLRGSSSPARETTAVRAEGASAPMVNHELGLRQQVILNDRGHHPAARIGRHRQLCHV